MVRTLLRHRRPGGKRVPGPAQVEVVGIVVTVGLQGELRALRKQLIGQDPVRIVKGVLFEIVTVVVLDDAAGLDLGKREGLRKELAPRAFSVRFLETLPYDTP